MKRTSLLIFFFLLCIATSVLANEKNNYFGIFYTPRFDYYFSDEIEVKDWFSYNITTRYNYEAGLKYSRSGKIIDKHVSLIYTTYRFDANYNYSFEVCEDETIGREYFDLRKINLEIGASKIIFKTDKISISPMIYIGFPSPLISILSSITPYTLNNERMQSFDFDFAALKYEIFKSPYIGLSINSRISVSKTISLVVMPFIKTYLNNLTNQDKHYSPRFSFGATVCLYIKN